MKMRVGKTPALTALVLVFAFSLAGHAEEPGKDQPAGAPAAKADEKKGDNQEVVIQGVQRLKVKIEKPEPDLTFDVDEIAVPYVVTEDSVLDVSPTSSSNPTISMQNTLNAPQSASPYIQLFRRPPILTLNPKYKGNAGISNWRLRITDSFGNVFKDFSGKSSLPNQIVWDGRDKENQTMLDVGTSYSYIFTIIDVASNPTSQMGKPIILESLLYDDMGGIAAAVVADAVFEKGAKTEISKKGKLYLKEVADLLTQRQHWPLIIEAYFEDVDDANYKGEKIMDYLNQLLTLQDKQILVQGRKSRLKKIIFRIK